MFVNLKCVVWHSSFLKILKSIATLSKTGFAHKCFDGIIRWLYPLILILSGDYEEQYAPSEINIMHSHNVDRCVMALIRGLKSHCPCPICLIPTDCLTDHAMDYPRWTVKDAKTFLELY